MLAPDWWNPLLTSARAEGPIDAAPRVEVIADRLEIGHGRGREGWLARYRLSDLAKAASPPDCSAADLGAIESLLYRVATAVVVRDLITDDQWRILVAPVLDFVDEGELIETPIEVLQLRIPRPLGLLLRQIRADVGPEELRMTLLRKSRTLQEIGDEVGVSRERVRQIEQWVRRVLIAMLDERVPELREHWNRQLRASFAVSEETLLRRLIDETSDQDAQLSLGWVLIDLVGAVPPQPFRAWHVNGFWTFEPGGLLWAAEQLETLLPCRDADMQSALDQFIPDEGSAMRVALSRGWTGIRFHQAGNCWVRSGAKDRDAAYLILAETAGAVHANDLAESLGTSRNALNEALRRDNRFVQLRPSGKWSLTEWGIRGSAHRTTLEATLAVLSEIGPVPMAKLISEVRARHPVTYSAVLQSLNHHLIGAWPDGEIDLVERGASPIARREPDQSPDVTVDNGHLVLTQIVDRALMRGSGLGVPPYMTWALGLMAAPSARTFQVGQLGRIRVKYGTNGSTISSLRGFAETLGAKEGCRLRVALSASDDGATIRLDCTGHLHSRSGLP